VRNVLLLQSACFITLKPFSHQENIDKFVKTTTAYVTIYLLRVPLFVRSSSS